MDQEEFILGPAGTDFDFYKEARILGNLLSQPVSKEAFMKELHHIGDKRKDEESIDILEGIARRFGKCWENAPVSETLTPADLLFQKKGKSGNE